MKTWVKHIKDLPSIVRRPNNKKEWKMGLADVYHILAKSYNQRLQ